MSDSRKFFHIISYLQYPFTLSVPFVLVLPVWWNFEILKTNPEIIFNSINNMFVLMGIGIGFSTLQDTTKVQNEISRKVWADKRKSLFFLSMLGGSTFLMLSTGLLGYFLFTESKLHELSLGLIVFGISLLGMLKAAIEMAENHKQY